MAISVNRSAIRIVPDATKVIPRFFNTGEVRSRKLILRIVALPEADACQLLGYVMNEFKDRYRNIELIFDKHFSNVVPFIDASVVPGLSREKRLLIGSYFTMEYALEAAALFNPSVVEDPDQSGLQAGEKNIVISFRATGEGHVSSLIFKRAKVDKNLQVHMQPELIFRGEGVVKQLRRNSKAAFEILLNQTTLPQSIRFSILDQLKDTFTYKEIEYQVKSALQQLPSDTERSRLRYDILRMVNACYEVTFSPETDLSERVIFPVTYTEKNGIEDARFVKFMNDDGTFLYIATYTAYDGNLVLPHLIETHDFFHFKMSPLHGEMAVNKNLALFPRKINGSFVMMSRVDGVNNYIMYSDDLYLWDKAILIQQPLYPWEFVQMGNGGSPIETSRGWLLITHGVGPMRKYCLGASLLDLHNPAIEIGRLKEPFLLPNEEERKGYVPNVVYSCGAFVHQAHLLIPYAVSDHATSFASILLEELLDQLVQSGPGVPLSFL